MFKDNHHWLTFYCGGCGERISVPVSCGNRFCKICGLKRQLRVRRRMNFIVKNTRLTSGERWKHLTLTLRNETDLRKMTDNLIKSFRKLRQRQFWKGRVSGGFYVIEITGKEGNWHAHIHAMIVSQFFQWHRMKSLWESITGSTGVYIQNIPPSVAVKYMTKYLTKDSIDSPTIKDINSALKGRRLFQPFGRLHAINLQYTDAKYRCPDCGSTELICLDFLKDERYALVGYG